MNEQTICNPYPWRTDATDVANLSINDAAIAICVLILTRITDEIKLNLWKNIKFQGCLVDDNSPVIITHKRKYRYILYFCYKMLFQFSRRSVHRIRLLLNISYIRYARSFIIFIRCHRISNRSV